MKNGIPYVLEAMKIHKDSLEVTQQGLACLFCILSHDPFTKMNIHNARTQALTNGINDISQYASNKFPKHSDIKTTVKGLQEQIFCDWS